MIESPRYAQLKLESRPAKGVEIDDLGRRYRVIETWVNTEGKVGYEAKTVSPLINFGDVVVFSTEVYYREMALVLDNGEDEDNKGYLPVKAAKVWFVVDGEGEGKVLICDEKMSHEIKITGRRDKKRWDELLRKVADVNQELDEMEVDDEEDDGDADDTLMSGRGYGTLIGEEKYGCPEDDDEVDDEEIMAPWSMPSDDIMDLIWEPGWRVEEVLRRIAKGEEPANAVLRYQGRLDLDPLY